MQIEFQKERNSRNTLEAQVTQQMMTIQELQSDFQKERNNSNTLEAQVSQQMMKIQELQDTKTTQENVNSQLMTEIEQLKQNSGMAGSSASGEFKTLIYEILV